MAINALAVFSLLGVTAMVHAQAGDKPDGLHSFYVHRIGLYPQDVNGLRGPKITSAPRTHAPFSTTQTCNWCHDVNAIGQGLHFNAMDPQQTQPGRKGEPWIYTDPSLVVQIPLSYRGWVQTFLPEQIGLNDRDFVREFAHHLPGGGTLEIDCLACHSRDPRMDMGGAGGYGDRLRSGQTAWAVTAGSGVATVSGGWGDKPLSAEYPAALFDDNNDVYLDLTQDIPDRRCEYCHATTPVAPKDPMHFALDPDVHQSVGLKCVACHRAGPDHKMATGEDTGPTDTTGLGRDLLTCRTCHLGDACDSQPTAGRLGAPVPQHKGIPAVHFETLACAACHAGPWPQDRVGQVKTSRAHRLGTTFASKDDEALPHVYYPVYARVEDGRIHPCKLIWPAYWGVLSGDDIAPVSIERVRMVARQVILRRSQSPDGNWPALTDEHVIDILKDLDALEQGHGAPVYVCGGRVRKLDEQGELVTMDHPAANPCLWPTGHAVRPAAQALGVRTCRDCHREESSFFFGRVPVDSPMASDRDREVSMIDFLGLDPAWARTYNMSFHYRPWLKLLLLTAGTVLAAVVLCFGARGANCIVKALGRRESS